MAHMRGFGRSAPLALVVGLVVVLVSATPAGAIPVPGGGGDDPPPDCVGNSSGTLQVSPTNPVAGQDVTVSWSVDQNPDPWCTVWKFIDGPGFFGASVFLSNSGSRTVRLDTQGFKSWSLSVTGPERNTYQLATASATAGPGPQYGWGRNFNYQINPAGDVLTSPTQVRNQAADVVQETTNGAVTVAVHSDGSVWTWGDFWLLGDGSTSGTRYWQGKVPLLPRITQVALAQNDVLALDVSGAVWAWGSNVFSEDGPDAAKPQRTAVRVPLPGPVVQLAAGGHFSVALLANGDVYTWGLDTEGQLADGQAGGRSATPVKASGLAGITQIAAGHDYGVAVAGDGSLYAWGLSDRGELGQSVFVGDFSASPVRVEPAPTGITRLVAADAHVLALTADGTVYAWGDDECGQVGDGVNHRVQTVPTPVPLPAAALQVSAGFCSSYALLPGGTVWIWGEDLRNPGFRGFLRNPTQVVGLPSAAWVAAGYETVFVSLAQ
jgi:alpha-tubulin suppressor-like RCC1 family protein